MKTLDVRKPIDILVVEDDEVYFEVIRRAFKKRDMSFTVYRAETGIEALEMLRGENNRPPIPMPHLMLVDINMPRMNGIEMVQELRKDEKFRQNVVFMLTTSARMEDKVAAYTQNVAGYFLKENLGDLVSTLDSYSHGNEFPGN